MGNVTMNSPGLWTALYTGIPWSNRIFGGNIVVFPRDLTKPYRINEGRKNNLQNNKTLDLCRLWRRKSESKIRGSREIDSRVWSFSLSVAREERWDGVWERFASKGELGFERNQFAFHQTNICEFSFSYFPSSGFLLFPLLAIVSD